MAQKVRMKIFERMKNGRRRHVLTVHGVGRTKRLARANVSRLCNTLLRRKPNRKEQPESWWHVTFRTKKGNTVDQHVKARAHREAVRLAKAQAVRQGWPRRMIVQAVDHG